MKRYMIWTIATLWMLSSCTSVRMLSFDELVPAKLNFPPDVRTVAVVNNMPDVPVPQEGMLTLGELNADGKFSAEALATSLADSKYFSEVVICDSALHPKEKERMALSQEEIRTLSDNLGADLIFSLDRVVLHTAKEDVFYPDMALVWQAVEMKATPVLSIYMPSREKPLHVLALTDSVYVDVAGLSSDKQLMEEGGRMAAGILTQQLVPYWKTVERTYFGGGCVEMRDAEVCVRENDWEGARKLWMTLYECHKKGSLKMKAAFNTALSYEMAGDLKQAAAWLEKAERLLKPENSEKRLVGFYKEQLQERMETMSRLNLQMSRFDNKF